MSAGIDGGQPHRMTFGDNATYTDWRRDNFLNALQEIVGRSPSSVRLRIGIEFDHLNLEYLNQLKETFVNAMIREIAATFPQVELVGTWTWFQSGINTDGAHNPVTNKKGDKL